MGSRLTRVLAVFGAVAILVVGVNAAAYAATGKSLLLGKTNKASKTTTIQNTKSGAALQLKTKSSATAPLKVNGKGKVVNLNADKVDGLDGTAINTTANSALAKANAATTAANDVQAIRFKDTSGSRAAATTYALGKLPAGTYLASFNASVTLGTAGTDVSPEGLNCYLWQSAGFIGGTVYAQNTAVDIGAGFVAPSFSNVVTFTGNENLSLTCTPTAAGGWTVPSLLLFGQAPTISFTKLDGVTNKTMAP